MTTLYKSELKSQGKENKTILQLIKKMIVFVIGQTELNASISATKVIIMYNDKTL